MKKVLWPILILALIVVLAWNIYEHLAEGKLRCVSKNCREILWTKDNQEQLDDIWACKNCMDRAQEQAIDELGYRCVSGTYQMDPRVPDRIYKILTGRKRK